MGIHWSLPLLEALLPDDLNARLKEAQNDPFLEVPLQDKIPIVNGLTGKLLKALPVPKTIRVSRRKMRAFCTQGLDVQVGTGSNAEVRNLGSFTDVHASMARNLSRYLTDPMGSVSLPRSKTVPRYPEQSSSAPMVLAQQCVTSSLARRKRDLLLSMSYIPMCLCRIMMPRKRDLFAPLIPFLAW